MRPSTHHRPVGIGVLALLLILATANLHAVGATLAPGKLLRIEPASTWVGIARVYLEIEDLHQAGETLEGTYHIRVPLAPSQNDTGRITLHTSVPIDALGDNEATVVGSALSSTGHVHEVVARMLPNGIVRIDVTTPERTLRFKSRFASPRG